MKSSKSTIVPLKPEAEKSTALDRVKWFIFIALVLAGSLGNHYYSEISMPIRTLAWLGVLAVAGLVASTTQQGKLFVSFFRDSRLELRKVIWPTRDEVAQTTLVVGAMVVVLALVLWGMDGILVWLIGWLTGQRG